ncbi:MAG: hypothetical protein WBA09_18635 [Candidatus Acidiferrum sp.]
MHSHLRSLSAILATALLLSAPSFAFETPLSDEAVRDAYFLGQRHEQDFTDLMANYTKSLPPPDSGPDISSITFLTPYALVAQLSSQRTMNYSAQQAERDHRNQKEIVRVIIEIQLTATYGALIPTPTGPDPGSPVGFAQRPSDFWKDFQIQVLDNETSLEPLDSSGTPHFGCDPYGGCILTGATLQFDFPAEAFVSDSSTIQVFPPEGDPVSVDFDLSSLR